MAKTALVIGGTGYLGQFLIAELAAKGWKVGYTHHSTQRIAAFSGRAQGYWVDLASGEGLQRCFHELGQVDAVINCAAVSQPALCERDPSYAHSINVPATLLAALEAHSEQTGAHPLLLHLSTDQVYDGSRSGWNEDDECRPVNQYGRTKLAAEREVAAKWARHVILRSSIIYGGPPPGAPVGRPLFLQFVDGALASGKATPFFEDEWRSPVFVGDIVAACMALLDAPPAPGSSACVFNMGGPQRLSRVDMALAVAAARGYDAALVLPAPAASVDRGVASPADISMDSSRLWQSLGLQPLALTDALRLTFAGKQ